MPNLKSFYLLRKSTISGFTKCINTFMVTAMLFFCSNVYAGSFTASGTTLTLDLDVASQLVTVVSTGTTYTFTLSGGATNTWTGTTDANITVSGNVLTVTATGLSTFGTINITDSQTGNAVTFNTSGANAYSDNINITLNNSPGAVTFNGTSSFSGTNAINVTTSMYITFAAASGLSTANGNLTLDANTQATPNNFAFSGIAVNAATVQVTGTGVLSMRARGGSTGASASFLNKGIVVYAGGQVKGGTTGTATFEGWGYTGLSGTIQAQGVVVNGTGTLGTSTISSNGANVSVTGYGSNTTAAAVADQLNIGVVVGSMSSNISLISTTDAGIISSGGSGAVVVNGYGGNCANPASVLASASYGVYVAATSASITSGGDLAVTGIGGGPDSLGGRNHGVYVYYGTIISGTNGNLVVTGTGGNSKSILSSGSYGVQVNGGTGVTKGQIKAGAGTGTTLVTGTGGGLKAAGINYGINVSNYGIISSLGSGSVTVIGYGGNLNGTGATNIGVRIEYDGIITSNGGNVRVEGTGGGGPTTANNYGIQLSIGAVLSAGGSGTVTAIGRGGNVNGISGNFNYGVYVTATAGGHAFPYITSSGGNVTVTGTGGGGSSGSASASSSNTNYGVFMELGGYITAGGTGNVTVTGTGGNSSTGATGANNYGVYVGAFAPKGTTEVYRTAITSGGGNITINGTGGGNGASATNYGVYNKGLIKATGAGTVSITGTSGNTSGSSNVGVFLDGAVTVLTVLYPATISSEAGNVTVTGTGGTVTSGSSSGGAIGVYLNGTTTTGGGGSIITAGGSGNVTVTGYGGQNLATSGSQNHGVYVNTGLSPNFSTITSGGGNVTVTGTGGGGSGASASGSSSNFGVYLGLGGSITAGVNGTVSVTGNGGNNSTGGSGGTNSGVSIGGGTTPYFSKITSNNGAVTVTGNGGGSGGTATNNYGVNLVSGGQITSAGIATAVTVNGTGGSSSGSSNHGTFVTGTNSIITSGGGNLAINGTEGSSATSLALSLASSGAIKTITNGGDITITGNSFGSVAGTSITAKSDGVVNIFPKTSGTTVSFASTMDARGSIYINTAELATITGGTINIGNSNTGAISISQAVTVPTGSNLNLATASSSAGLNPKLNGTEITMAAGKTLGLTGISSLNIAIAGATVNTQYDQFKVVADVTLTGMTLSLSGAYTPTGGEVFTIVDATSITGIFTGLANGATVTFNGINLTINYTSTTVTLTAPCTNPTAGGTIAAAQSGTNPFTPAAFTSSASASGQFGIVEYKWQSSITSNSAGFADIASSNADTYDAGALTVTTWFKRLARVSCSADWSGAVESNVIEVTVTNCINPTAGGTIAAAQNGTTPFNPAAFTSTVAASGHSGTLEYKWQSSITNANTGFSDIASSNADTYDEGALTVTTWFKRLARVSCSADWTGAVESNVIEVTVTSLLPVAGIELNGTANDKQVKLGFKAINEREMANYIIERSANGTNFANIGSQQPANASQATISYSFIDNQPIVGNNYYRIKGSSINGQIQYSNVVVVKYGLNAASVSLFPNPITSGSFMLKLRGMEAGEYGIQLFTNQGKQVMVKGIKHFGGSSTLKMHLPSGLSAGIYFIRYTKNNVVLRNEQVIIE